jgi:hypothetical protein
MDPVRGGGAKPVTATVTGGQGVDESRGSGRPDALTGTPATGVYRPNGGQAAARGEWPALPDPGQTPAFGEAVVDRCGTEIAKLEAELDKLGTGPEDMAKAMKLQRKFDTYMRIMTLISEIWKGQNDAIRSVINNIN